MDMSTSKQARNEVEWRERMARFAASGQTVKQFCQAESISEWTFYRWRRQLTASADAAPPAGFIDVGAVPAARPKAQAAACTAGIEVRLELGHGLVLHIVRA